MTIFEILVTPLGIIVVTFLAVVCWIWQGLSGESYRREKGL